MKKFLETYIFGGFGFNILLKNIVIRKIDGEEYPDINMNELKLMTAKALLKRPVKMTGLEIKFLRNFLKISFDILSEKINVPSSTIRSWENKGKEVTGLTLEQEKAFRIFVINTILESERNTFDKELIFAKSFSDPKQEPAALDIAANTDYSFVSNG